MLTNGSKRTALLIYYLLTTAYDALRSRDSTAEPEASEFLTNRREPQQIR
jgi:hypothetical protein